MKRLLSFAAILLLIVSLTACQGTTEDYVRFFYCRNPNDDQFFDTNGVIQSENREIIGHHGDIRYLIGLYLAGPTEEGLVSPLPKNTRLLEVSQEDGVLTLSITDLSDKLTDSEFTLACACLTLTCTDYTDCESITIISGQRSTTMNRDSILLLDIAPETTEGG